MKTSESIRSFEWAGETPLIEHGAPGCFSDESTAFVARHLAPRPGCLASEPGCGTGMIAVALARLGAATVYATDLDPVALECARRNAEANQTPQVVAVPGSLLEPIPRSIRLDLVVAILPHRPAPAPFSLRLYGGWDGTDLIMRLLDQCEERLSPGGVIYLYHNAIANPRDVLRRMNEIFRVERVAERRRAFTREEFEDLHPGMMAHLLRLREEGMSEFREEGGGYAFSASLYRGERRA